MEVQCENNLKWEDILKAVARIAEIKVARREGDELWRVSRKRWRKRGRWSNTSYHEMKYVHRDLLNETAWRQVWIILFTATFLDKTLRTLWRDVSLNGIVRTCSTRACTPPLPLTISIWLWPWPGCRCWPNVVRSDVALGSIILPTRDFVPLGVIRLEP